MNPELAMVAMNQENNDNNEQVFQDVLMKTAIAHRLKRNISSKDLSFTIIELTNMIQVLIDNCCEIIEFAVLFDCSRPSHTKPFAPRLEQALPVKLSKRKAFKEAMADSLVEIFVCGKTLPAVPMWHQLYLTRGLNLGVRCWSLPCPCTSAHFLQDRAGGREEHKTSFEF